MQRVKVTRFDWDADNRDVASVDFELGHSRFRFWTIRRYEGANGVRHYVNPPARKIGDDYCPTVEFPTSLRADVEDALLRAFHAARQARDSEVGSGPTAGAGPHVAHDIPF